MSKRKQEIESISLQLQVSEGKIEKLTKEVNRLNSVKEEALKLAEEWKGKYTALVNAPSTTLSLDDQATLQNQLAKMLIPFSKKAKEEANELTKTIEELQEHNMHLKSINCLLMEAITKYSQTHCIETVLNKPKVIRVSDFPSTPSTKPVLQELVSDST
jgi:hypothetical protein